jgi:uncharacterized protein YgiM (DUF1202 family)
MKRHLILFAIVLISLSLAVGSSFAQSTVASGTVTAYHLNVRTEPSITAIRIATVSQGYTAGVIGKNSDSTWYQIILEGGSGWVSGRYLSVTNAHTVPVTYVNASAQTPIVAGGIVNTGALNIRPIPSPTNNVPITYVLRHTPLMIFARNADSTWLKVTTSNNIQGWVRSKYITVTSGTISAVPILNDDNSTLTPTPPSIGYAQGYVNTGALNIRSVPSAINNVPLMYILRNTSVSIIGRTHDSTWYQVSVNNVNGWVRSRYITLTTGNIANAPVTT